LQKSERHFSGGELWSGDEGAFATQVAQFDEDGDGKVTFDEFVRMQRPGFEALGRRRRAESLN